MEINVNWEKLKENDLYNEKLYEKIVSLKNFQEKSNAEVELFKTAKKFKMSTAVQKKYYEYEKKYKMKLNFASSIDFNKDAPIKRMFTPGYYKDSQNNIRIIENNNLVTSTMLQPIAILKNNETGEELVKCAFLNRGKWCYFIINRESLQHNGKITKLANKGVDVTSDSARFLVGYIRDLLNNNEIPEFKSTSKMGWHNGSFLPYDDDIQFDGEENYTAAFNSLHSKGSFEKWYDEVHKDRIDNVPLKLVMATSFASPLLHLLHKQSFVTLIWGKTGGKKTVAGRIAMSIWGDSEKGKLMFSMDSTTNFYYRTADFFNHLPVFFDELQTYKGDINGLVMKITEGIDRGRAKNDGGTEKSKTWNNSFIMTGEQSISDINSGGGTLNRLIEIYITKDVVENGINTCNVINENYGFAGKIFIDYLKNIDKNDLNNLFYEKYNELMAFDKTEEKQAINMAMLLLADDLACRCIFKDETPLKAEDVLQYMFSKKEIDNTERAYQVFLDECDINKNKFNPDIYNGEFWGVMKDYEISIISNKLRKILEDNKFSYKKVMKDWEEKGYIERNSSGRYSTNLMRAGRKGNYIVVKIVGKE